MKEISTKFIDYKEGPAENLFVNERIIDLKENHYLMKVKAVGINRAETLHRLGKYPIKNEVQKNIGLQAAGEIIDPKTNHKLFDAIGLLSGGSYAQWVVIPKTHVMSLPTKLSFEEGAAIPEAWLTAFQLIRLAQLKQNQKVVIYAGASGVGTAAIQICNVLGIKPYAVVSTNEKSEVCKKYGVKDVVCYKQNEKWDEQLLEKNNNQTFDAVLDCVCSSNIPQTIKLLGIDGRWVLYGGLSGMSCELNLQQLLAKRIKLITTTLKTRSKQYKDELVSSFIKDILPQFDDNSVRTVIDEIIECDWSSADSFIRAHKKMQSNQNAGKIIIKMI